MRRLVSYNYYSGEPVTGVERGCPLLMRRPQDALTLPDFMRAQLYAAMATLSIGMEILWKETSGWRSSPAHGGLFKTPGWASGCWQEPGVPVAVMETAERAAPGAWPCWPPTGRTGKRGEPGGLPGEKGVRAAAGACVGPDPEDRAGFQTYIARYKAGLAVEKAAAEALA